MKPVSNSEKSRQNARIASLENRVRFQIKKFIKSQPETRHVSKDFQREYLANSICSVMQMSLNINSPKSAEELVYQSAYMLYAEVLGFQLNDDKFGEIDARRLAAYFQDFRIK